MIVHGLYPIDILFWRIVGLMDRKCNPKYGIINNHQNISYSLIICFDWATGSVLLKSYPIIYFVCFSNYVICRLKMRTVQMIKM